MQNEPEAGQLVITRKRPFVVTEIITFAPRLVGDTGKPNYLVKLSSVEDDGLEEELQVIYQARSSGRRHTYLVAPLQIILYLRCHRYDAPAQPADDFRTLAVHCIKRYYIDVATFPDTHEEDHDPHFDFPLHELIWVKVAFWGDAATYVAERTWSPDRKLTKRKDGALILIFIATSRFRSSFGCLALVPTPSCLSPVTCGRK